MTQHGTESKLMCPGNQGHIGPVGRSLSEDWISSTSSAKVEHEWNVGPDVQKKLSGKLKVTLFFGVLAGLRSALHLLILKGQWGAFSHSLSGPTPALSAGHTKTNRTICCPGWYRVKAVITFDTFFLSHFFLHEKLHRDLKQPSLVSKFNPVFN